MPGDDGPVRVGGGPARDGKALPVVPVDRVAGRCPFGGCVPAHPDLRFLAAARYQVGHGVLGSRGRLALRGCCSLVGKHHEQRDDRGDDGSRHRGAGPLCQHVPVLLRPLGPLLKSPGAALRAGVWSVSEAPVSSAWSPWVRSVSPAAGVGGCAGWLRPGAGSAGGSAAWLAGSPPRWT